MNTTIFLKQNYKAVLFIILFSISASPTFSQSGAAINRTGATSDPSAILDISATDAGLLIPRMTEIQKNSIPLAVEGLLIYQTDGVKGFWYFDGASWVQSLGTLGATGATGALGATGATGYLTSGSALGNTPYWDGITWVVNSSNIFNDGSSVGIGTNSPDPSAIIDINSSSKGALIPRLTNTARNSISNPADGLIIFNNNSKCLEIFINPLWQTIFCGCNPPNAPTEGTHNSTMTQIVWNWNTVVDATGYKYNTINDFSSAIDNGTSTSFYQTNLTCNTTYNLYVWAYGICGNSQSTLLTQTTLICCGAGIDVTFNYNGYSVTYGTLPGQNGTCWLDRNLGAITVATAYNHTDGLGDLFQWGRNADGHQLYNSTTTTTQSSNYIPGHAKFIMSYDNWYTGTNPTPDNLWQGTLGYNNPCPSGWRVPTENEVDNELQSWNSPDYNGAIASSLKLPAPGLRLYTNAGYYLIGGYGCYWTSTVDINNKAKRLYFTGTAAIMTTNERAFGMSVRCIKD